MIEYIIYAGGLRVCLREIKDIRYECMGDMASVAFSRFDAVFLFSLFFCSQLNIALAGACLPVSVSMSTHVCRCECVFVESSTAITTLRQTPRKV